MTGSSPDPEYNALPKDFEERMKARRRAARERRSETTAATRRRRFGPYALLEEIGEGPAGKVWLARDPHDSLWAVKILRGTVVKGVEEPGQRETVAHRDLAPLAGTEHPHRVTIREVLEHEARVGIVMEQVSGITLDERLRRTGPLPYPVALRIVAQVCDGLASYHAQGAVHGDVKPRNVFLTEEGVARLSDPSTARDAQGGTSDRALALAGTPTTFAPEMFEGAPPSPATDVYAAGVLAFHTLSRSYPAKGPLVQALRATHTTGSYLRLGDVVPQLPAAVIEVVESAIDPDPVVRPDAAALRDSLAAAAEIPPQLARMESASGLARWWWGLPSAARRGLIAMGVAGLFVLLLWRSR